MKIGMRKTVISMILAIVLLTGTLAGCGAPKEYSRDERKESLAWANSSAIYEVNLRQYTKEGTINAFAEHLDEIKDMGIEILWLMPIHPISKTKRSGKLGSYYSITDYKEINPEFGTKEDFKAFVKLAHEKGFHVMMDWVANHTGWDSTWITDHKDWYTQDSEGNVISPLNMGWPDVADLNFDNEDMRKEMISCMKYWVKEFDIDGFRCDYASGVPTDFWEQARKEIETVKPVYMLAEDGSTMPLLENAFDMNYNWKLYDAMVQVAHGNKKADKLKLYSANSSYPVGTYPLNFLDNHDKNSYEGTIVNNFGLEALDAFWTFIYTIPGTPLVYSGDEISYNHAIAFMEKDTISWSTVAKDERALITKLGSIRAEHASLNSIGGNNTIKWIGTGNPNILAYERMDGDDTIICIINFSKDSQEIKSDELISAVNGGLNVLLHGSSLTEPEMDTRTLGDRELANGSLLEPWEYLVLGQ